MRRFFFFLASLCLLGSFTARADGALPTMPDYFVGYWAPARGHIHSLGYDIKASGEMYSYTHRDAKGIVESMQYRMLKVEDEYAELLVRSVFLPAMPAENEDVNDMRSNEPVYRIWILQRAPDEEGMQTMIISEKDPPAALMRDRGLWHYSYEALMNLYKDFSYPYSGISRDLFRKDDINNIFQQP